MLLQTNYLKTYGISLVRIVTGLLYVFAGFVKLVDPWGAQIKLEDYFEAFHLTAFMPLALVLGVAMALLEFALGWVLILRVFRKWSVPIVFGLTSFFTLLTLVLAIYNPVSDCGCFGDAIKLTNWQTFFKNVVLFTFSLVLLLGWKFEAKAPSLKMQAYYLFFIVLIGAYIPHYSYYHLPILDFRPYAVGNDIPALMTLPEDAPQDEYQTLFYYAKDGVTQEFTEENYPWEDSTWTFVEMKTELLKKGMEPPISGLLIEDENHLDVTKDIITSAEVQYLIIAYDLEKSSRKGLTRVNNIITFLADNGKAAKVITASSPELIDEFKYLMAAPVDVYIADETVLKTIIRANPGLVILKDGVIIGKYSSEDFPSPDHFKSPVSHRLQELEKGNSKLIILYLLLIFGALIIAPTVAEKMKIN